MKWNDMTPIQKVLFIISCVALVFLPVSNVMADIFPIDMTYPAIVVFTVCEAVVYWKQKRKWSYLLIGGAVISLACFVLELWLLS